MAPLFTKLVTLLAVGGAGVSGARAGDEGPVPHVTPTVTAAMSAVTVTGANPLAREGPVVADGEVEMVPSRVDMRCRFGYIDSKARSKVYRVFMRPRGFRYDDWCQTTERLVRARCAAEVGGEDKVRWLRCHDDERDVLWAHGHAATFELRVPKDHWPRCVGDVLPDTVPGSVIDWMHQESCYENFSFEIEWAQS